MGEILEGDCLEVMAGMEENSVDSIVCDPPYELTSIVKRFGKEGSAPAKHGTDGRYARLSKGFMGKSWDGTGIAMRPEVWQKCLRIAKPGAYLLAFGGTRTLHRLACAIEDAGWTLRDTLSWNYGSGFPKSHDVSKALDSKAGAEREVVGQGKSGKTAIWNQEAKMGDFNLTAPATPEAKQWNGFGTALKPAWEPVLLFQKPLEGTYAENVLKWGCGALNIDACRIGNDKVQINRTEKWSGFGQERGPGYTPIQSQGRWPANFLLSHTIFCEKVGEREVEGYQINSYSGGGPFGKSMVGEKYESEKQGGQMVDVYQCVPDCPVAMLDEQSGTTKSTGGKNTPNPNGSMFGIGGGKGSNAGGLGDTGGSSRFFYCAKASREERNAGLEAVHTLFEKREAMEDKIQHRTNPGGLENDPRWAPKLSKNHHPTVKPIALMRYLCRLVTPPGGTVLDCFAGSGSTGCAAALEGFQFIGIEKEKEYAEIARARMAHFSGRMP